MLFAMGDDFSYGLNTLGPLCLWQCLLQKMASKMDSVKSPKNGSPKKARIEFGFQTKVYGVWNNKVCSVCTDTKFVGTFFWL